MSDRLRDSLALVAWTSFLVVTLVALHALGEGPLAAPSPSDFGGWFGERDAPTAVFALLRLALLGAGWYLLTTTILATILRAVRAEAAASAVEACTPAPVRRLVRAAAGLSIAASVLAVSAAAAHESGGPVVMRRLPDVGPTVDEEPVTMTRLPDDPVPVEATPPSPDPAPTTWTVAPGDHFWSIAREALQGSWERPPTDAEVDPYWRLLIEQNRHRLADPANPDLLHPGLEILLPPSRTGTRL